MFSVSRFRLGKAVDSEKLVSLGPDKPVLTKLYSEERLESAGKCWVWLLPSGRRNWILRQQSLIYAFLAVLTNKRPV